MAAKKLKKKTILKKVPDLQKMADDITTTTFLPPLPGLSKAKESMNQFDKLEMLPPLPEPPLATVTDDFGPMLDYIAAIALCVGFVMVGIAIGMWR